MFAVFVSLVLDSNEYTGNSFYTSQFSNTLKFCLENSYSLLFYHLGQTTVGRRQSDLCTDHDIQLNGVLVAENHW